MSTSPSQRAAAYTVAVGKLGELLDSSPHGDAVHDSVARIAAHLLVLLDDTALHRTTAAVLYVMAAGVDLIEAPTADVVRAAVAAELGRLARTCSPDHLVLLREASAALLVAWEAHGRCIGVQQLHRIVRASPAPVAEVAP